MDISRWIRSSLVRVLSIATILLAGSAIAAGQDQASVGSQGGTSSANAHPTAEEPKAATSAATEALQKATQNPVASLISVPV
jgi:hypothetical protein